MSNTSQHVAQPKLRASCDSCGAAKLKCDRTRPECGRCVAHDIPCVYGVSRKVGKPPRGKPGGNGGQGAATTNHARFSNASSNSVMSYAWDLTDGTNTETTDNDDNNITVGDGTVVLNRDAFSLNFCEGLSGSSLTGLSALDFVEWGIGDPLGANDIHRFLPLKPDLLGNIPDGKPLTPLSDARRSPNMCTRDPECHREACELVGRSLFDNVVQSTSNGPSSYPLESGPVTARNEATDELSLDHLLLLNRKSSERVSSLLTCSCAKSPYLMILYASLISAILVRYQHAVGCTEYASWNQTQGSSPSNTGSNTSQTGPSGVPTVAPARIAMGVISVDDDRVQSALNSQLLAGEVRNLAGLVGQFACYLGDQYTGDGSSNNVDSLHQALTRWLRDEHSRITEMIKTRLKELNT
jgi:hypothetical protein